jgi:hypothetical protein
VTWPETRTFWLEQTGRAAVGLRRYSRPEDAGQDCEGGYHSVLVFSGRACIGMRDGGDGCRVMAEQLAMPHDDPRWPVACRCGYEFTDDDEWQDWQEALYRRADTGEIVSIRDRAECDVNGPRTAPPGAMWDAWWLPDSWRGPDRISLAVRLPNGVTWLVDSRASNCTMPDDDTHHCWVRVGNPRLANVTVGKTGGPTCDAGAGSILGGDFHGWLRDGVLTAC